MLRATIVAIIVVVLMPLTIGAETIYTWKDKNGVTKFSNEHPPEGVTDYKTIEGTTSNSDATEPDRQRRSSFDQMVEQASVEAKASNEQRKKEAAVKAQEEQRIAEEKERARRQAERQRLEAEIEAIKNRAVSRTYPNGMKQAQINALLKAIEDLEQTADTELPKAQ